MVLGVPAEIRTGHFPDCKSETLPLKPTFLQYVDVGLWDISVLNRNKIMHSEGDVNCTFRSDAKH
jgi:hypothetical protein